MAGVKTVNLAPAKWIWLPSQRTLANTVLLFRRVVDAASPIRRAVGHVTADSRYLLSVNGRRVQFGAGQGGAVRAAGDEHLSTGEHGGGVVGAGRGQGVAGCRERAASRVVQFGTGQGAAGTDSADDEHLAAWEQGGGMITA